MAYIYGNNGVVRLGNGGTTSYYQCRVGYEPVAGSEDIGLNTSQFKLRMEVRSVNSSYQTFGYNQTTTLDGVSLSPQSFDMRNTNVWQLFGERTITVTHDTYGKYSQEKYASFTTTATGNYSLKSGNASVYVTLPDIPRQANITEATNFNDEQNPTITYSNPAGDIVSSLQACISLNGTTDTIAYRDISKTGTTYTFELTQEERNTLRSATPNSNTLSVFFIIKTVINNLTLYSSLQRQMTIVNGEPIFSDFDYFDINPTTIALTNNTKTNVNGYSNIRVSIPEINKATAVKSATMSKYRFTCGTNQPSEVAYSDSEDVYMDINGATSGTYNVFAIDSRNNAKQVVKLATTELAYTPISFNTSSCSVVRNNGGVGRYAVLTLSGNIWNNNFGLVTNSIKSVSYQYKKTSETQWQTGPTVITPTLSGNTFSFEDEIASNDTNGYFDLDASYNFKITITDELSTKEIELTPMASAVPNISLADNGVGIMCDYDETLGEELQVGGIPLSKYPRSVDYAVATISSNQTAGSNYVVELNSIESTDNNMFSLSNGDIIIGAGVNTIRIGGAVFIEGLPSYSYVWARIDIKDSNNQTKHQITCISNGFDNGTAYTSAVLSERIIQVQQGDIIRLTADSPKGGTIRGNYNQTWVQVEKVN